MKLQGCNRGGSPQTTGFTRTDLLTILGVLVVLGVLANPPITPLNSRTRANSLVCQANLAKVGRAFQLWAADHGDWNPSMLSSNLGGLYGVYLAHNAWYQYAWISNELATPKVLVCPADTNTVRRAQDFSYSSDGGFLNPAYRNNALSYMLGLHTGFYMPGALLSADRNIEPVVNVGGCSYSGLGAVQALQGAPPLTADTSLWGKEIHSNRGNILFNDGSVQETSSEQLQSVLARNRQNDAVVAGPGPVHTLYPR